MFTALICVPLVAWRLGANPVLTFWVAYVLTRPIGASFADFFGMPKNISGMGLGHGAVSVVTLIRRGVLRLPVAVRDRPAGRLAPRPAPRPSGQASRGCAGRR